AVFGDVRDRAVDAVHHARSNDGVEIFRVPVLFFCCPNTRIGLLHGSVTPDLTTGVQQTAHHGREMCVDATVVYQQRLGSAADAGTAHLRIEGDGLRHVHVGITIDVHVAVALQMTDDRHTSLLLDARDQALAAPRDDDIQIVRHVGEHVTDRGPVDRRHELDALARQSGRSQPGHQAVMYHDVGTAALRAAAQDDCV